MPNALPPPLVLADANLLVKDVESATFFDFNKLGLISLHWTPEIEAEYIEHRARLRAKKNARPIPHADDIIWAGARIETHKKFLVPDAMIKDWRVDSTLESMKGDRKFSALLNIPDPDDVHVAMAAAFLADSSKRPVILATHDVADLKQEKLTPFHVSVLHPGDVLDILYLKSPRQVATSLLNTCHGFSNPALTEGQFLRSVSSSNQFDNPPLAKKIEADWNTMRRG